jgi:isopenicillin N synthase-like dioxygenase
MQSLSRILMKATLQTLSSEEGIVEKCFASGEDTSLCRLNYYPICPNPETNLGVGPHSDPGIITILLQDDIVTSLQVERDGKFYDVPPVPSTEFIFS